jgi:hypothetical protein
MALSYYLELEVGLKPQQALQIVANACPFQWQDNNLVGLGIQIRAFEEKDEENQALTEQFFGFVHSLVVSFRISSNQDIEQAERLMIRATLALLQKTTGDAVLLFNYENIVLQRIKNQLVFNQDFWDPWKADEIKNALIPYSLKVLSSPLL